MKIRLYSETVSRNAKRDVKNARKSGKHEDVSTIGISIELLLLFIFVLIIIIV